MRLTHLFRISFLAIALAAGSACADAPGATGRQVGDLALVSAKSMPIALRSLVTTTAALFLLIPPGIADPCELVASFGRLAVQDELPRWGVWLGRTLPRGTCAEAASIPFYQRPAAAEGLPLPSSLPELWVVDDSYRVRLRLEVAGNGDWARIAIEIDRWLQGRGLFEANCGHCHGMDGAQASSAEVKSLVGISSRYPETEVLRLGAQFGGVDMTGWSEAKKRTLLAYIRGL